MYRAPHATTAGYGSSVTMCDVYEMKRGDEMESMRGLVGCFSFKKELTTTYSLHIQIGAEAIVFCGSLPD